MRTIFKTYEEYVRDRMKRLFKFDRERLLKLLEIAQYSIIYAILGAFFSSLIDHLFKKFLPYDENASTTWILFQITFQCVIISLTVYYLRKITHIFPFVFMGLSRKEYRTMEYQGNIMLAMVFLGTQFEFMRKLILFQERISAIIFKSTQALEENT